VLSVLSRRRNTCLRLPHPIPESVKEERLRILMEIQKKISFKKYRKLVAKEGWFLWKNHGEEGVLRGRLNTQAPEIDGSVLLREKLSLAIG